MDPFEENVNESDEFEIELDDDNVEEATNVGGFANQNSTAKSHVPNSNGRAARNQSKGGEYTSTQNLVTVVNKWNLSSVKQIKFLLKTNN